MKHCRNCKKEIFFICIAPKDYQYKDCLGYYCSYNCYRKKGAMKDNLLNVSNVNDEGNFYSPVIKELSQKDLKKIKIRKTLDFTRVLLYNIFVWLCLFA